jgi:hypothetical protein
MVLSMHGRRYSLLVGFFRLFENAQFLMFLLNYLIRNGEFQFA